MPEPHTTGERLGPFLPAAAGRASRKARLSQGRFARRGWLPPLPWRTAYTPTRSRARPAAPPYVLLAVRIRRQCCPPNESRLSGGQTSPPGAQLPPYLILYCLAPQPRCGPPLQALVRRHQPDHRPTTSIRTARVPWATGQGRWSVQPARSSANPIAGDQKFERKALVTTRDGKGAFTDGKFEEAKSAREFRDRRAWAHAVNRLRRSACGGDAVDSRSRKRVVELDDCAHGSTADKQHRLGLALENLPRVADVEHARRTAASVMPRQGGLANRT